MRSNRWFICALSGAIVDFRGGIEGGTEFENGGIYRVDRNGFNAVAVVTGKTHSPDLGAASLIPATDAKRLRGRGR